MSETRTRHKTPVENVPNASPQTDTHDPLQESLDELVRMADSLVDGLALEEPDEMAQTAEEFPLQPLERALQSDAVEHETKPLPVEESHEHDSVDDHPICVTEVHSPEEATWHLEESVAETEETPVETASTPVAEVSQESRRAALRETLDALNDLIDDPSPPLRSAEIQVGGDHGEDISVCLDKVMAPHEEVVEAEPVASDIKDEEPTGSEVAEKSEKHDPPVAPADPTEETEVETAVAVGADPFAETRGATSPESSRRSGGIWWLVAIVVVIAALAASYYVLQSRSTTTSTSTGAEVPVPDPPVVFTKRPRTTTPTEETAPAEPAPVATEVATGPVETPPVNVQPSAPIPAPVVSKPSPTPANQAKLEDSSVATPAHDTAPPVEEAAPKPDLAARAEGTPELPLTGPMASRGRTTETDGPAPQTAGIVGIPVAEIIQPPEPKISEPVAATPPKKPRRSVTVEPVVDDPGAEILAPAGTPPVVIDRIEPIFDHRTLRRGEEQNVVLRVLVDDRGRVVRVVVEDSVAGSDAEFAAINAVLRWTYEPAQEEGKPVRAWTTESFEFAKHN